MGDVVAAPVGPWGALAAQVNRFGPGAPSAYRFALQPYSLATGNPDLGLAVTAATVFQRRAADAYNQFSDAGSAAAIARANQGLSDPLGFVTANLSEVTSVIGVFADSLGLAPAAGDSALPSTVAGVDTTTLLMIAGIGLALWVLR